MYRNGFGAATADVVREAVNDPMDDADIIEILAPDDAPKDD